jgi:hypothetical protein
MPACDCPAVDALPPFDDLPACAPVVLVTSSPSGLSKIALQPAQTNDTARKRHVRG